MNSSSTLFGVSFDTHDAAKVAQFWAGALGRQLAEGADIQNTVVLPADITTTGPRLAFHQVPEGKTVKNRLHFDLTTTDLGAETERLQQTRRDDRARRIRERQPLDHDGRPRRQRVRPHQHLTTN
jgi:hypothetical protein